MKIRSVFTAGCCMLFIASLCSLTSCSPSGSKGPTDRARTQAGADAASAPASAEPKASAAPGAGGWMEGIPEAVPPVSFGTFDSDQSYKGPEGNSTMYSLYYEGVTPEQAKRYTAKLTAAGFQIEEESAQPGEMSLHGFLPRGEGRIGFSFSLQANGHVDYTLNIIKKYQ